MRTRYTQEIQGIPCLDVIITGFLKVGSRARKAAGQLVPFYETSDQVLRLSRAQKKEPLRRLNPYHQDAVFDGDGQGEKGQVERVDEHKGAPFVSLRMRPACCSTPGVFA